MSLETYLRDKLQWHTDQLAKARANSSDYLSAYHSGAIDTLQSILASGLLPTEPRQGQ